MRGLSARRSAPHLRAAQRHATAPSPRTTAAPVVAVVVGVVFVVVIVVVVVAVAVAVVVVVFVAVAVDDDAAAAAVVVVVSSHADTAAHGGMIVSDLSRRRAAPRRGLSTRRAARGDGSQLPARVQARVVRPPDQGALLQRAL